MDPQPRIVASEDMSEGSLPPLDKAGTEEILIAQRARRLMRWAAFIGLGAACLVFLAGLFCVLFRMLSFHRVPILNATNQLPDTHMAILVGLAIVVFAAIPLSLAMTLVKLSSDPKDRGEDFAFSLTTPQFELIKSVFSAIKSLKGD